MSDHSITKIKYQELVKLREIQKNKNNREFKIKTKFNLTFKHISIKTSELSDIRKMKSFKTSHLITVSHNLKLTSLVLFKKHFSKNALRNKMKKIKIMLNKTEKVSETISIREEI